MRRYTFTTKGNLLSVYYTLRKSWAYVDRCMVQVVTSSTGRNTH